MPLPQKAGRQMPPTNSFRLQMTGAKCLVSYKPRRHTMVSCLPTRTCIYGPLHKVMVSALNIRAHTYT
eukprot:658517-Pelagomonas_calceolata.AAC.1